MDEMTALYRVAAKSTGSVQPGSGGTDWSHTVLYCGYDRAEALRTYREGEMGDYGGSHGNPARFTYVELQDADAENAFSTEMSTTEIQ